MQVEPGFLPANPASRILSLGLLTILLGRSGWVAIAMAAMPLLLLAWRYPQHASSVWIMLRRVRWLLLSIAILYLWFTPGEALLPAIGQLSPSKQGLVLGLLRILSLLVIISYCLFLLRLTSTGQLITGLQTLLTPFSWLGLETARLAVRLGLVLDYVPRLEEYSRAELAQASTTGSTRHLDTAARLFVVADNPPQQPTTNDAALGTLLNVTSSTTVRPLDIAVPLLLAALLIVS